MVNDDFQAKLNPDPLDGQHQTQNQVRQNYYEPDPWVDKTKKKPYIESSGHSTILYTKGKADRSETHAFHSGIGDNDDLMTKKPVSEDIELPFQYGVRLRGKKKHSTMIYPEINFQYGIHFKGDLYKEDNQQEYEHRVDAYPGKSMEFSITQEKPLPTERSWEAELTLQTMIPKKAYGYAVKWEGLYEVNATQNAADLFTSQYGYFMGPGPTGAWVKSGTIVKEIDNRSHFSGIVAKNFYDWENYEAEFDFKPIKATGLRDDPYAKLISNGKIYSMPGVDNDILGFIFKAKQENGKVNDFYIFLWEADIQVVSSWRPKSLNGYNVLTGNISGPYSHEKAEDEYAKYMTSCSLSDLGISNYHSGMSLTSSQLQKWNNFVQNNGWGTKHARVYRVTNGVLQEVSLTPKGSTAGWKQDWWNMNMMNSVKIRMIGRRVKIYTQSYKIGDFDENNYRLVYEFDVAPGFEKGSVGLATFSQAVEFHRIRVAYWEPMSGRIPATGYTLTNHSGTKTIANTGYDYVKNDAKNKAHGKPFEITKIIGEEDPALAGNGSITTNGPDGPIKVSTTNPSNAGQIQEVKLRKSGKTTINPDQKTPLTAKIVFRSIDEIFGSDIQSWLAQHPEYVIENRKLTMIKPSQNDKDWDLEGETLKMWNSAPEIVITKRDFVKKVYAYEGWKKVVFLNEFDGNPWSTYRIEWKEETVNPDYDEIQLVGKWPDGYVMMRTTEWYEGVYPADIKNIGIVTNERDVLVAIPPMPEHYVEPNTREVMYHGHEDVHFLLTQIKPKTTNEVWMGFDSKFNEENTKITTSPINVINGRPIIKTDKINDKVRIHCVPKPRYEPWTSGKYIGYGKVNGKRPYLSNNRGKADMVNVPTNVVFLPKELSNIQGPFIEVDDSRVNYTINPDKTVTFSSNYMDSYVWYTDWYTDWKESTDTYTAKLSEITTIESPIKLNPLDDPYYDASNTIIEKIEAISSNPFVDVWAEQINGSINQYKIHAKVKHATPLPWHPMIHNGYYYFHEKEHYLYAQKIHHIKKLGTDIVNYQVTIHPRPQQGSAIIVRDKEGAVLRKVTFFDENWNLTLENTETFNGNGYSKYYLSYRDIDSSSLKVTVNGKPEFDYIWDPDESSLQFMRRLGFNDVIEVKYKLLYSYMIDMNYDVENDIARITIHDSHDEALLDGLEIIYEGHLTSPFYRAKEAVFNPILNHNHKGFLYVTKQLEQFAKSVTVNVSPNRIGNTGLEKVLVTGIVKDQYDNPIPLKKATIYRDDVKVYEGLTNEAGEIYFYDQPPVPQNMMTCYKIECEGITNICLLNFFVGDKPKRSFIEMKAGKSAIIAGTDDEVVIEFTLRDDDWYVLSGKTVKISYTDTNGNKISETKTTDAQGKVFITLSGLNQQHGVILIRASYDMGEETTENYLYIKVIGG
jgi:hypothetical protein